MTALCLKETLVGLFMYLHIVNQHKIDVVKTQQKKPRRLVIYLLQKYILQALFKYIDLYL